MEAQPTVLDVEHLREVTLDDETLMREVLGALIEDTAWHIDLLSRAIVERNAKEAMRLAHCSKGACASLGAQSSAAALVEIERTAAAGDFDNCGRSLNSLAAELKKLREHASAI